MNMPLQSRRGSQNGFTLIELMIAVAIIGILMRLAYPAYNNSVKKARRADAKTALLDLAQREERWLATANIYSTSAPELGYAAGTTVTAAAPMSVVTGSAAFYQVSVSMPTSTSFLLTAARISTSPQIKDTQCGDFTLTNTGLQGVTNATTTAADCW
jgi:type IV pilus assembly protein PilE